MTLINPNGLLKAYVAGPIFNHHQISVHENMVATATGLNYRVFSPYVASAQIWKGRKPKDCSREERLTVRNQNIDNLHDADVLVSWLNGRFDDGRCDTGVSWEMGYSYATMQHSHGIHPLQIGYLHPYDALPKDLNLMLAETLDALVTDPMTLRDALALLITDHEDEDPMWHIEELRERYDPGRLDLSERQQMPEIRVGGMAPATPISDGRNDPDYGASDPH